MTFFFSEKQNNADVEGKLFRKEDFQMFQAEVKQGNANDRSKYGWTDQ